MRHLLFLLCVTITSPSWGAPILVKSGEHGAFTRLVVYLPEGQVWGLSSKPGLTTFTVENWTDGFNISDAFTRIDNERVRSLAASDGNLVISLGCDCQIVSDSLSSGLVILDVSEITVSPQLEGDSAAKAKVENPSLLGQENKEKKFPTNMILPVVIPTDQNFSSFEQIVLSHSHAQADTFQRGLGAELARSSTLSYLKPSGAELIAPELPVNNTPAKTEEELLELLSRRAQFTNAGTRRQVEETEPEFVCPDPGSFAISLWGGELEFADQLAKLRSALYSEFDRSDQTAIRNLVRFYIHYALIPEAENTIKAYGNTKNLNTLLDLAKVLDENAETEGFQDELVDCKGETGFWSFISQNDGQMVAPEVTEDLIATFQILPLHLKELTADRIIDGLEVMDQGVAADIIRNSMTRDVKVDERRRVLKSDLSSKSQADLVTLVEKNDELSPQALEQLLRNSILTDQSIALGFDELTSSYIRQLNGSEISNRLASLQVINLVKSGEPNQAMELFFEAAPTDFFEYDQLLVALMNETLFLGKVSEVSELVFRLDQKELIGNLPTALRIETGEFFRDQGQPQLAEIVLGDLENEDDATGVFASTYAQSGDRESALDLVNGIPNLELEPRISELLLMDDPSAAWAIRDRLSGVAAREAAWLTQNWQDVPAGSTRSEVAALLGGSSEENQAPEKPIQASQEAFLQSTNARRVLSDLLRVPAIQN